MLSAIWNYIPGGRSGHLAAGPPGCARRPDWQSRSTPRPATSATTPSSVSWCQMRAACGAIAHRRDGACHRHAPCQGTCTSAWWVSWR